MKNNHPIIRVFSVLLAVLLLMQPLCVQASPAGLTVSSETVAAAAGEDVSVLFTLENNPGINSLKLKLNYDSNVLTLKSVTDKNLFGSAPTKSKNLTDKPYNIIWATAGNVTENGNLVELTFHVSETAAAGTQVISVTADSVFDENDNPVAVTTKNAQITINGAETKPLTVSSQSVTAAAGEDVSVLFTLENNPGINSLKLKLNYDSNVLTLKSVTDKNLFGSAPTKSKNLTDKPYNIIWATAGNVTASGDLVELTFHVSETAAAGTQVISVTADSVFDENETGVAITTQDAEILIAEAQPIAGEIKLTVTANGIADINALQAGDIVTAAVTLPAGEYSSVQLKLGFDNTKFNIANAKAITRNFVPLANEEDDASGWSNITYSPFKTANTNGFFGIAAAGYRYDDANSSLIPDNITIDEDLTCFTIRFTVLDDAPAGESQFAILNKSGGDFSVNHIVNGNTQPCNVVIPEPVNVVITDTPIHRHNPTAHSAAAATCEATGSTAYWSCSDCGKYFSDEACTTEITENSWLIPAIGHSFTNYTSNNDATCKVDGTKTAKCDHCDETDTITDVGSHLNVAHTPDSNTDCTKVTLCTVCGTTIKAAGQHTWNNGTQTIAPTCTAKGTMHYVCTVCSAEKDEDINALGHNTTHYTAVEATCTTPGKSEYWYCSRCTKYFSDAVCTTETTAAAVTVAINPEAHSWNAGIVTTPATCTQKGVKTYTCMHNAEHTRTEEVDMIAHSAVAHTAVAATCTATGNSAYWTCSACNKYFSDEACTNEIVENSWVIAALGHDLVNHDAKAATCTEKGWSAYDTCSRCAYTTYEEIAALGHNYQTTVTAPTCTAGGYTTHICSRCKDSYVDSETLATGHSWNTGVVTTAPTCTEKGVKTFTCTACSATRTEDVTALGHDLVHHDAKAATCTETGYAAYDTCTRCDYSTQGAEIPALGHNFQNGVCTRCSKPEHCLKISAQPVTAAAGEDVSVLFTLENNPGINSLKLKLNYDSSVLTLKSVTDKNLFGSAPTKSKNLTDKPYNLIWATAGNVTENGNLVELTFHVSKTAAAGTQVISVTADSVFDENENDVEFSVQNAQITIAEKQVTEIRQVTANGAITAMIYVEKGISAETFCAEYAANGQFLTAYKKTLTEGENTVSFGISDKLAASTKVFVIDLNSTAPLCAAVTAKK